MSGGLTLRLECNVRSGFCSGVDVPKQTASVGTDTDAVQDARLLGCPLEDGASPEHRLTTDNGKAFGIHPIQEEKKGSGVCKTVELTRCWCP